MARTTHAACDSHGDMPNKLTWSVIQGSGLGTESLFSQKRSGDVGLQLIIFSEKGVEMKSRSEAKDIPFMMMKAEDTHM